jgi:hypothetical protein
MTGLGARVFVLLLCAFSANAWATTYYVSSSSGSDSNSGTSSSTAWKTIAHVNGQSFNPGDSILFKRGDVWNESLAPASSGSSGNPITFDAYGTGAAPNLTGYYAVPTTAWVLVTGNAWKAAVPATYTTVNFCLFGSVWGQKVTAATANLTAQWDFYLANGFIYVYSQGNPAAYYNEPIVPMALSNVPVININGQSWLTVQHFLVNWFDQYGVYVQGTSDHLVFANMEADSMIPQGTQPLGFYVDESAPGPGDIKIYNAEAHLNYDGFRFDGAATAITMVNDKGYANRDGALVDNTGAVTYSYCHFYASSLAVAGSTDVEWTSGTGPVAGAGNIAADTAPAVQVYQRYPANVTLTVDDSGMTSGADTYYAGAVLPIADAAGVPVGAAITVGYPLAQTLVSEFQGWVNAGRDVTSHSVSHTYYTNTDALEIQYMGSGTAAALSISNKTLTITVTGAADSVSYNLAQGQAQGTIFALQQALAATGKFTTSYLTPCQGPYGTGCSAYTAQALLAQDLADVSGQDVKTSVYHMELDVTRLTTDEITLSRLWMTTNLTGLPATPVYVYPGGYETTAMQGITAGIPYMGARGALKEDLGVKDTYADGFNVQNITSFGVNPSWMGLAPAVLNQKIQALVWKESVWGVPWGIFWHLNELTNDDPVGGTEITNLIQDFKASGATMQTNTSLVNWLLGGTQKTGTDGNYYYKSAATSMELDFRPTENSPVVNAGQNLGTAYELDINGVNQNTYGSGWEIGAHVYEGYAVYGGLTGSYFTIGGSGITSGPFSITNMPPASWYPYPSTASSISGTGPLFNTPIPTAVRNVLAGAATTSTYCFNNNCGYAVANAQYTMTNNGACSERGTAGTTGCWAYYILPVETPGEDSAPIYPSQPGDPFYSMSGTGVSLTFQCPSNAKFSGSTGDQVIVCYDQTQQILVEIYADNKGAGYGLGVCPGGGHAGTLADPCPTTNGNGYPGAERVAIDPSFNASQSWDVTTPGDYELGGINGNIGAAPLAPTASFADLLAGTISHAIQINAPCSNPSYAGNFPANGVIDLACSPGVANQPVYGGLYTFDYTNAQLTTICAAIAKWKCAYITAITTYGMYFALTGGGLAPSYGLQFAPADDTSEGPQAYYSLGVPFSGTPPNTSPIPALQAQGGWAVNMTGYTAPSPDQAGFILDSLFPKILNASNTSHDLEGNACNVSPGCYPSGHFILLNSCVARTMAGVSGGC